MRTGLVYSGAVKMPGGVAWSMPVVEGNLHSGIVIGNSNSWTVRGSRSSFKKDVHSCAMRRPNGCVAATELRAIYYFLGASVEQTAAIVIKMSHPRALAQMRYWLSVADESALTMPRWYLGRTLPKLAMLVHRRHTLITVEEAGPISTRLLASGSAMNGVMLQAIALDHSEGRALLHKKLPPLARKIRTPAT